jgi:colanic acid/amylovoran biosynthesis glycosyltransferase
MSVLAMEQAAELDTATMEREAVRPLRVAYLVSRFPKLSETFVLYELLALGELNVDVSIYPLLREREAVAHAEVERVRERVRYTRLLSRQTLGALAHFARRKPRALASVSWLVARGSFSLRRRRAFVASLATLPKAVADARQMEAAGVEHVHAHFATHATTAAMVVKRLTGIPYSFTAHAHDIYVDQRLLREKTAEAAFVATISEYNRAFIARHCRPADITKLQVVHCGVDTTLFVPPAPRARSGPLRIVCVGSLEPKKGQRYLVDACRLLRDRGVAFRCEFIGGGEDQPALTAQVSAAGLDDSVTLRGAQPRAVVLDTVRDADVVVLPSIVTASGKMEGIPVALMEALACARPVVATRISGVPELVSDGDTGLLVEQRDARALADALQRLHADPQLAERLGAAGRRKVLAEFDLRANAATLRALIAASVGP